MIDRHHVIFERVPWQSRKESKYIREASGLLVPMERDIHDELHRNCPPIPMLGYQVLMRTLSRFEPTSDSLECMGRLQYAIEHAADNKKAKPLERELCSLAVRSIDLQKPFVKEALPSRRKLV